MVKFGDRMIDMQHAGWEAHYINYEELKLQIDNIEKCQTDDDLEAMSDEFLATLKQMLVGVDAFVAEQMSTLQAKTDLTDAKSLHSAKSFLKVWPHRPPPCIHARHAHVTCATHVQASITRSWGGRQRPCSAAIARATATPTPRASRVRRCCAATWGPT